MNQKPKLNLSILLIVLVEAVIIYYVEGILKNIDKGYAYHLRVKIQSLDKYGKLASIDECYADPSTLAPDKEATYQPMVNYNSKIDKFSKTVYWSNTY